jgi:hypothetical protein
MWIAERTFWKMNPEGETKPFLIRIGIPQKSGDDWSCKLQIEGLDGSPFEATHTIHGVDAWQALTLSMGLARNSLEFEIEKGARIVWPDSEEEFDLNLVYPIQPSSI